MDSHRAIDHSLYICSVSWSCLVWVFFLFFLIIVNASSSSPFFYKSIPQTPSCLSLSLSLSDLDTRIPCEMNSQTTSIKKLLLLFVLYN